MQDKTGKRLAAKKRPGASNKKPLLRIRQHKPKLVKIAEPKKAAKGFDPELLYVECARCGAPVVWEPGKATHLMEIAGVDPSELDSSCMLVTDSCPACGNGDDFSVRIFRVSDRPPSSLPPNHGHA